jgi:hypothetical protein
MVKDGSNLVVGAVRALHHPMHGMELRLVKGDVTDNTTLIPTSAGPAGKYKRRWILDGFNGGVTSGIPNTGVTFPTDSGNYKKLAVPADWNDLQYLHQPLRYHSGAKLKDRMEPDPNDPNTKIRVTWKDELHAHLSFRGGTMTVLKPNLSCFEKGLWKGKTGLVEHFEKPIATSAKLNATISSPLVLTIGGETLSFVGDGNKLDLHLFASSQLPYMKFKSPQKQVHAAMSYQLMTKSDAADITSVILPEYFKFDNKPDECIPSGSPVPGEGCSPAYFA